MPGKRKWTQDQLAHVKELFHSDLTNKEVAKIFGCDFNKSIKKFWLEWYGEQGVHDRFRRSCSRSRVGELNPMFGRTETAHPRYKKSYVSSQGYVWIDAPEWFVGSKKNKKAMEHNVVWCENNNLTKIPKGYVVHHKDEDKTNNKLDNLQMMTISEHMIHHHNWHK